MGVGCHPKATMVFFLKYYSYSCNNTPVKTLFSLLFLLLILYSLSCKGQSVGAIDSATGFKNLANLSVNVDKKDVTLPNIISLLNTPARNCIPGGCTATPVTLLSFEGRRTDVNTVFLKWKTTNELNSRGFDVERSLGNPSQFMKVAFVPALADVSLIKNYELTDPNSFAGTSYYRLKQIDIDSQFSYSKTISINNNGAQESLTLYPNPTRSLLYLKIVSQRSGNEKILLYDTNGKVVNLQTGFIQRGSNLLQMNVSSLAKGMYFIRLCTGADTLLVGSFTKE
jgi:hypothetical protein